MTKPAVTLMICTAEIPGEYLTAGQVYEVTRGRREWHFQRPGNGSATFMASWQAERAIKSGKLAATA